jgi:hypothetical protein
MRLHFRIWEQEKTKGTEIHAMSSLHVNIQPRMGTIPAEVRAEPGLPLTIETQQVNVSV